MLVAETLISLGVKVTLTNPIAALSQRSSSPLAGHTDGLPLNISEMMKRTRKSTNSTWAIHAEVPAIPVKPKNPAIMAIIRKTMA
jgi:hypothetical protein